MRHCQVVDRTGARRWRLRGVVSAVALVMLAMGIGAVAVAQVPKPAPSTPATRSTAAATNAAATNVAATGIRSAMEKATAEYVAAFNRRDDAALAAQWTGEAVLAEGGGRLVGRERIMESISAWRARHPQAAIAITLSDVLPLADTLARVSGTITFTPQPGARGAVSHFVSLRVLVDGRWCLAESIVTPSQDVAMEQLDWLLGTWTATDPADGAVLESRYERAADGHVILGRTTITPASGTPLEAIDVIHADAASGTIRSWVFDSTGARAEGVFQTDGTVFNRVYQGTAAPGSAGTRTAWVQMMVPTDRDTVVLQAIERTLDGRPVPDGRPWHLKRKP